MMHSAVLGTASCHHKHDIVGISPSSERTWPVNVCEYQIGVCKPALHTSSMPAFTLLLMFSQTGDIYTDTLWKISAVM